MDTQGGHLRDRRLSGVQRCRREGRPRAPSPRSGSLRRRDAAIERIAKVGRRQWRKEAGARRQARVRTGCTGTSGSSGTPPVEEVRCPEEGGDDRGERDQQADPSRDAGLGGGRDVNASWRGVDPVFCRPMQQCHVPVVGGMPRPWDRLSRLTRDPEPPSGVPLWPQGASGALGISWTLSGASLSPATPTTSTRTAPGLRTALRRRPPPPARPAGS